MDEEGDDNVKLRDIFLFRFFQEQFDRVRSANFEFRECKEIKSQLFLKWFLVVRFSGSDFDSMWNGSFLIIKGRK